MEKTLIWIVPYLLSWILHATWVLWGKYLVNKLTPIKKAWKQYCLVFGAWVVIVVVASGCPFFYLHQSLEIQMGWREKITYKYKDSIVYQYLIHPVQAAMNPEVDKK